MIRSQPFVGFPIAFQLPVEGTSLVDFILESELGKGLGASLSSGLSLT